MRTTTETDLIAGELKNAGFGVEIREGYNLARVFLSRKVSAMPAQIDRALDNAGILPGMYEIREIGESVYVRGVA